VFIGLSVISIAEEPRYILTLEVKQYHYTLNVWTHIKDAENSLTFQIPVDKTFYDSVQEKQELSDNFRTASVILKGSFGGWKATVIKKETVSK